MSGYLKLLGALRLVDLLAGNSRHPALLAISDMIVDAAALSVRDNDAAAADGRALPSTYGVHVLGRTFCRRHLGRSETWRQRERCTSDCERLAPRRLVARGRQRHAGSVPGGDRGSRCGPILLPIERSSSLQRRIHSEVRTWLAYETVRQLIFAHCNLKLLEPNGPVGDDDD
jgi:hypothetical protein